MKNDSDPDLRAHQAKQDQRHENAKSKYKSDLAKNTHGDALAALWGKDSESGRNSKVQFELSLSDLNIYMNELFQSYNQNSIFDVAKILYTLSIQDLLSKLEVPSTLAKFQNRVRELDCLSENEQRRIFTLVDDLEDAAKSA